MGAEAVHAGVNAADGDQVLVGQVGPTRTPEVKAVFVLGMNEGKFPRAGKDETILSHWERRELARLKVELDPGSDRQRLDEHFLGYVALTRASSRLIVSRPLSDEAGRPDVSVCFLAAFARPATGGAADAGAAGNAVAARHPADRDAAATDGEPDAVGAGKVLQRRRRGAIRL